MNYYEVMPADSHYHANTPLTYSSVEDILIDTAVTISLKNRVAAGVVVSKVAKPKFNVKPLLSIISYQPLPPHTAALAKWMSEYYACTLAEALRQFMPGKQVARQKELAAIVPVLDQLEWHSELVNEQKQAIRSIRENKNTTVLLHGQTGSGKTRVYIELAREALSSGKSVIILTPEITLTAQLEQVIKKHLSCKLFVIHSQLSASVRKKLWLEMINRKDPSIVIGPRSALFSPIQNIGLMVLDESHEPAYSQNQSPRYHASRVASKLGQLTGSKVVLGSATPLINDYYIADRRQAVVKMENSLSLKSDLSISVIDATKRDNFTINPYISNQLVEEIRRCLSVDKQTMVYLNRRGSSRLILCQNCGWQLICPNCDIPLVYHGDLHICKCHTCNYSAKPPGSCPVCSHPDLIYKSIGSKELASQISKLFPGAVVKRFDGDNQDGERLDQLYPDLKSGKIDIIVGTQILAKGLDLPRLGLVGIISAESSMGLPDFSSEERSFQLLYQVIGRVGRGHGKGRVIVQSYEPRSIIISSSLNRDWESFYSYCLAERKKYNFPPYRYLMQLVCKKLTASGAENASKKVKMKLVNSGIDAEIIGPTPSFYARRGDNYYYQLVIKAKKRSDLIKLSGLVPPDWQITVDPLDLL